MMSRFIFDESVFWDNPNYVELKPGWWILKIPGEVFIGGLPLHPHDPIFTPIGFALGASASSAAATGMAATAIAGAATAGTMSVVSSVRQGAAANRLGKQRARIELENAQRAQDLARRRAAIERENAKLAKKAAAEEAVLEEERGQKFLQRQKVLFSASGVRSDIGAPLVIEAQTIRDLSRQKGFILEEGRDIADIHLKQARYEEEYGAGAMMSGQLSAAYEKQVGRSAKRQSNWDAWSSALQTGAMVGFMGYQAGWFSGPGTGMNEGIMTRAGYGKGGGYLRNF
jgi:hypothetical protein